MIARREGYWAAVAPWWRRVDIYHGPGPFLRDFHRTPVVARNLLAAHWCVSEVRNGRFYQLFWNNTGVLAPEAADGLEAIGLLTMGSVVRQAMRFFGPVYPRERLRRIHALETFESPHGPDEWNPFAGLDERFVALMRLERGGFRPAADAYAEMAEPWA